MVGIVVIVGIKSKHLEVMIKSQCHGNHPVQRLRHDGPCRRGNRRLLYCRSTFQFFDKELRLFALRVSPSLADKLFRRSERIYIDKQAFLLWMNSKEEFAEFHRQNTSQSSKTILEIEL